MPELFPPDQRRSLRSQSLDLLRFPLAVVVASIHVVATRSFFNGSELIKFEKMPGSKLFYDFFDAFLRNQSVPIYFFIAGFVFFIGIKLTINTYGHKLQNRTHSLLIPYISWNLLAVLIGFIAFIPAICKFLPALKHIHLQFSLPAIMEIFWNSWYGIFSYVGEMPPGSNIYPQDYPLWFVRDLMIIVVCTPLIYLCLRKTSWYVVAILGAIWFVLSPFKLGHFSQMLTGFFFFTWGAHMSYHGQDMITEFRKYFKASVILYLLISTVLWLVNDIPMTLYSILKSVNVVAGMISAYCVSARLIESRRIKISRFLAAASFFVYAGHGIFVSYVNLILMEVIQPKTFIAVSLIYFLTLITTIGGLLLLFKILGRYTPSLQLILAGRKFR
ncbi:MAG: acyltransferase [Prevotella sp.]|nr:acyltransferase [Bacteroides sp.]MCM1365635.1 acyltransferase [Prevotella sp.]